MHDKLPTRKRPRLKEYDYSQAGHYFITICTKGRAMTLVGRVCAFKSLPTRLRNKSKGITGRKIWQDSFHEHIIRNEQAYFKIWKYIGENPIKWEEDRYFAAKNEGEVV